MHAPYALLFFSLFGCLFSFQPIGLQSIESGTTTNTEYVCSPCGYECDKQVYDKPGSCQSCGMKLVDKNRVVFKNIAPAELCTIVANNKKVVLLDVRSVAEFNNSTGEGRLKNAINIPIDELESRLGELKKYQDNEIIVYCSHSHRSPRGSHILTENGFKNAKNMEGGMSVWNSAVPNAACQKGLLVK